MSLLQMRRIAYLKNETPPSVLSHLFGLVVVVVGDDSLLSSLPASAFASSSPRSFSLSPHPRPSSFHSHARTHTDRHTLTLPHSRKSCAAWESCGSRATLSCVSAWRRTWQRRSQRGMLASSTTCRMKSEKVASRNAQTQSLPPFTSTGLHTCYPACFPPRSTKRARSVIIVSRSKADTMFLSFFCARASLEGRFVFEHESMSV